MSGGTEVLWTYVPVFLMILMTVDLSSTGCLLCLLA